MGRLLVLLMISCWPAPSFAAHERVALVLANADYGALGKLSNTVNDARALARVLETYGYHVTLKINSTRAAMLDAMEEFADEASGAKVAIVYYAGHGLNLNGRDIIAPIDMFYNCRKKKYKRAIPLSRLRDAVQGVPKQVFILDSCRNASFPDCPTRGTAASTGFRGLGRLATAGAEVLIANATAEGSLAQDGPANGHSPFAASLLRHLKSSPKAYLLDILSYVSKDVAKATNGEQIPEYKIQGGAPRICMDAGKCGQTKATAAEPPGDAKPAPKARGFDGGIVLAYQKALLTGTREAYEAFLKAHPGTEYAAKIQKVLIRQTDEDSWNKARGRDTIASYENYLELFPDGLYRAAARKRMASLKANMDQASARDEDFTTPDAQSAPAAGKGNWVVILGSYPHRSKAKAIDRIGRLARKGLRAKLADTDDFPNLRNGLWAVVLGPFDRREALSRLRRARRLIRGAYVKSLY